MSILNIAAHAHIASLFIRRSALLATVSVSALAVFGSDAVARALNGGSSSALPASAAVESGQVAQAAASRAARDAQDALQRATRSIQAIQATQQAARDATRAQPNVVVPNGLVQGGLQVGTGLWQGAQRPTESISNDRTTVTVKQTAQKAILEWSSFNVGAKTELYFDQRAGGAHTGEWIALNRVLDSSGAPSRILGSIKAEGQVYVINRNGIVFGGASQVNVNSFVASSLSLSNEQFKAGIAKTLQAGGSSDWSIAFPTFGDYGAVVDVSFRADQQLQPAFTPGRPPGEVLVEAGGTITAAAGGKAMLFAPRVTNRGTISVASGQIIMAAGEQVYLTPSTSVRGLDVAVSAAAPWMIPGSLPFMPQYPWIPFTLDLQDRVLAVMDQRAADVGYRVTNSGVVTSTRGDITMQGREIVQAGFLHASTALNNQGGSVRLQAWSQGSLSYFLDDAPKLRSWRSGTLTLAERSVILVEPDLTDVSEIEGSALKTRYEAGRVTLDPVRFNIDGGIRIAGGTVKVTGTVHQISLGATSVIDVSGQWINELTDGAVAARQQTNGGTIDLRPVALDAKAGATLDTSGGALLSYRSRKTGLKVGNAGSINLANIDAQSLSRLDLRGYAAGSGGSLSITTDAAVQIGGNGLVRTMSGGDIRVLVPGGGLQVAALNTPVEAGFGLVTLGYGHIDIFADRNVVVNRSRILTFGGGDEIIWSTVGDIDAGRGAKTTRVPSKPEVLIDDDGNVKIVEKADIGGSGIGTIEGFEGAEPGDVDLIAPKGTVNAGDAGIRVAGNLNLAALRVLNVANIEVKGLSKGVPAVEMPVITGLGETVKNDAGNAAQQAVNSNQQSSRPSVIIVEVLGYGGAGSEGEENKDKPKPRERQSQDLRNRYQVLGAGDLTEDQTAALASENRRLVGR